VNGQSSYQNPAYNTNKNAPQYIAASCCVSTPGLYPGGVVLSGPLQGMDWGVGGAVGYYTNGSGLTTPGTYQTGGDYGISHFQGASSILTAVIANHFFARVGFDLTPSTQVFAQWMDGSDHTIDQCCYNYYQTGVGTVYTNNPFMPQQTVAAAQTAGVTSLLVGDTLRFPQNYGINGGLGVDDYRNTDVYVLGAKGTLNIGKNAYNWTIFGQQGINVLNFAIVNESIKTNLSDSIEAVTVGTYSGNTSYTSPASLGGLTTVAPYTAANFPNPLNIPKGTITCASNLLPLNNPSETTNCVPFNIFGIDGNGKSLASQAAINYTQGQAHLREVGEQSVVGGSITGEPFSDWAGPVSVALDAEYRHENDSGFGDPISRDTGFFSTNFFPYLGHQYVTEGALETVIPILKDKPFVQELDINGAARATDYSTSGYVTTYKYGLEYAPIQDVRLRAVASEDIRAPNLFNLFGYSNGHGTTADPFANNTNVPSYGITAGNPNLKPEKAHQYEVGVVFEPSEVPGLHLSIDYWHIKISGAIGTVGAVYELQQCYNTRIPGTFTGTSPYCALIARNPDGSLYSVTTIPFNIAAFLASGVDYNLDYRKGLAELVSSWKGTMSLRLAATNTQHNISNTGIPGPAQTTDAAGTGNVPRWAILGTLSYELDPWRFTWTERYDSSVLQAPTDIVCSTKCPNPIPAGFTTLGYVPRVPTYFLANIAVTYKFWNNGANEAEAFVNVNDLFNKIPPWSYAPPGQLFAAPTNTTRFDTMGLYVRAGIRFQL
jgi:outer membrane receptor protein involved in Fe transport